MIIILYRTNKEWDGVHDAFNTEASDPSEDLFIIPDEKSHYFTAKLIFGTKNA
jgi:hypothetical protein